MLTPVNNLPIAYDNHGDLPFDIPFSQIQPHEISIYLQLDTRVGKETCSQNCAHCLFNNVPATRGRFIDLHEGHKIMKDLCAIGYKVFPMISDSFAGNGEFMALFGNTNMREYCQGEDQQSTRTMRKGELWTSGAPLLRDNWKELLSTAVKNGFGSIAITFHGKLDEKPDLLPQSAYPISGVFPGNKCVEVIKRIEMFNTELKTERLNFHCNTEPLEVNLAVTLGKHNHTLENLIRYVRYFNLLPINVVRFNSFHDYGIIHPHLPLSQDEIAQAYKDLKWIHTYMQLNFQLGVDEDMGTSGIEVMGFPAHTGWCRAGRQLFAIVPDETVLLSDSPGRRLEKIGTVAACVDAFHPPVGFLMKEKETNRRHASYFIEFNHETIEELHRKRLDGTYRNGCFADEMLTEIYQVPKF